MRFPFLMKWMPVAKEKLVTLKKNAEPYVQMVSEKSEEVYRTPNDFIRPHLVNAQKAADPYFQEAKKVSKPYIEQIATATKPHVEKIRTTLKPYTKRARHVYEQFLVISPAGARMFCTSEVFQRMRR
ncbi:unnamed protein product [Urochloa humidicola]